MHVGRLPPQLSIINSINSQCEELAVEGYFEGNPRKIFHACLHDPTHQCCVLHAGSQGNGDKDVQGSKRNGFLNNSR